MAKTKKVAEESVNETPVNERTVNGFIAENSEKWNRAVHGSMGAEGTLNGGVGENASGEEKLAAYDKLGGYITKGGRKVKMGSFYDFKAKAKKDKPEVVLVFRDLEGNNIEVPEGDEVPLEARVAEIAAVNKAEKSSKKSEAKVGATSKKVKPSVEDED